MSLRQRWSSCLRSHLLFAAASICKDFSSNFFVLSKSLVVPIGRHLRHLTKIISQGP
jgi:hypothetical protein